MKTIIKYTFLIVIFFGFIILSCQREDFITDSDAKLEFSVDTVLFDTVFTTFGSTTQQLVVKNPYKENVKISSISLADNSKNFRLNINGMPANKAKDITIRAKDSMYIFVEVNIDPVDGNSPMVVHDSILFDINGNRQDVDLVAYGQNVHLINGEMLETRTWTNDKPYLIINSVAIDSAQTLTIEAGTRVHFRRESSMYVFGNLNVNGTLTDSVVFQGSRLEYMYRDVPGQWKTIVFVEGSETKMNYAVIKNGTIGLNIGTLSPGVPPKVELRNTKIEHMNYAGIYALGADIKAYNCLIDNCGTYTLALVIGGHYGFYHSTFANYWSYSVRNEPSVVITNNLIIPADEEGEPDEYYVGNLENAYFGNCIIYGNNETEIGMGKDENFAFNYLFDNCVIKVDTTVDTNQEKHFRNNIFNPDGFGFESIEAHDYRLDTLSAAKDKANPAITSQFLQFLQKDLKGDSRFSDAAPDIGAYERIE